PGEGGVVEEVEAAHLVGAVVLAIPRTHAAVVDHLIEPFARMDGGGDGAHNLAGRLLAVHAGDGLVVNGRVRRVPLVVAVHPDPVHLPSPEDFGLPHDRAV